MLRAILRTTTLAFGVLAVGAMSAGATETIVYANPYAEVYTPSKIDAWMMDEIEKRSNGEIKFEKYFSGSMLKVVDVFPGLQSGAADMVEGSPAAYNRSDYRLSNVLMPYISTKADAVTKALSELYQSNADLRKEYESRNAKVLYIVPWAENTFWSAKPLAKVDDFKGLKIRSLQAVADSVKMLGATPVAMPWGEAVEALGRGVVDAVSTVPFDSGVLGGIYESAKFGTDGGGMGIFSVAVTAFNKQRFESLSAEHQKIIEEVAAEAPARFIAALDEAIQKSVDKLCSYKGDLKITLFSEEEKKKVHTLAAEPLHAEWVKWAAETTKADTAAMLEQFLGLIRKHEADSTWLSGFERYKKQGCGA
jgi:TRAP-type C4-dicarboxylate transport system substrate-binding protein